MAMYYNEAIEKQIADCMEEAGCTREEVTCVGCSAVPNCEWQFDLYNTHGDCLAEK